VITGVSEQHNSVSEEPFYIIALDIQGFSGVASSLSTFSKMVNLDQDNQYSIGDRKIDATKVSKIVNALEVLVLHLKRFEYDAHPKTQ
jgi:ubiquitin C-terminal hydrolase